MSILFYFVLFYPIFYINVAAAAELSNLKRI